MKDDRKFFEICAGQWQRKANKRQIILIVFLLSTVAYGQKFEYKLTNNGTDPTEIRTRADLYFAQITSRASGDLFGSQLSGTYAMYKDFSVGLDIPYIYTDLAAGGIGSGIGDIGIIGKVSLYRQDQEQLLRSVAAGFKLSLDTGDADEGTGKGKYAITATINASYSVADEILITPVIESFSILDTDSVGAHEHEIHLKFLTVVNFEEGIWISIQPEIVIDLTGEYQSSLPLRTIIGYMWTEQIGLSAQYTNYLAGDDRINYFANLDLRYLF